MRYPDEPHVIVRPGVSVHQGAVDMLERLRTSGHRVELVDGALEVQPLHDLREDTRVMLEAPEEDLTILLAVGGLTVH
jgi:hypothetical protein